MCTFDPNPISTSPSQCFQRVPTALIEKLRADSIGFVAKPWCPAGSNNLITTTLRQSIRICCKVIHITTKFLYFSTFDVCFKCLNDVLNIRVDKFQTFDCDHWGPGLLQLWSDQWIDLFSVTLTVVPGPLCRTLVIKRLPVAFIYACKMVSKCIQGIHVEGQ